jgi:chromosome segregation and condensation protein ScpB
MARRAKRETALDAELADLPPELRWREWMGRVEAVIFASPAPVSREILARLVGRDCNLDLLIADIRDELRGRPYELASVAGGWQHRTKKGFADAIHAAAGSGAGVRPLSRSESLVLMAIAYFQPIARAELSEFFGKEVSRDLIGGLRAMGLIAAGPRSPRPGAPYAFVTTKEFLAQFGFESLRDLPDIEMLEDAGLLAKDQLLAGAFPGGCAAADDGDETDDRPEAAPEPGGH